MALYVVTLANTGNDEFALPASSVSIENRGTNELTRMTAIIPSALQYVDAIDLRTSAGVMRLYEDGVLILTVDLFELGYTSSASGYQATLKGQRKITHSTGNADLDGKATNIVPDSNGGVAVTAVYDSSIAVGDDVTVDGALTFTVGSIRATIAPDGATMTLESPQIASTVTNNGVTGAVGAGGGGGGGGLPQSP